MMRGEDGGVGGGQGLVGSCMDGNGEMAPGQKLVPDAALGSKWAGHRERRIESQLLGWRGNGGAVPDSHPNRRTSQPATRRPVFQFRRRYSRVPIHKAPRAARRPHAEGAAESLWWPRFRTAARDPLEPLRLAPPRMALGRVPTRGSCPEICRTAAGTPY